MRRVTVSRIEPEIEREKSQSVSPVLVDMGHLVAPEERRRLTCEDDDVAEGDRDVAPPRQDSVRKAAVARIEEAAIAEGRPRAREQSDEMADAIRVVRDECRGIDLRATGSGRRSAPPTRSRCRAA